MARITLGSFDRPDEMRAPDRTRVSRDAWVVGDAPVVALGSDSAETYARG
jgi:hypothetical protein